MRHLVLIGVWPLFWRVPTFKDGGKLLGSRSIYLGMMGPSWIDWFNHEDMEGWPVLPKITGDERATVWIMDPCILLSSWWVLVILVTFIALAASVFFMKPTANHCNCIPSHDIISQHSNAFRDHTHRLIRWYAGNADWNRRGVSFRTDLTENDGAVRMFFYKMAQQFWI